MVQAFDNKKDMSITTDIENGKEMYTTEEHMYPNGLWRYRHNYKRRTQLMNKIVKHIKAMMKYTGCNIHLKHVSEMLTIKTWIHILLIDIQQAFDKIKRNYQIETLKNK